MALMSSTFVLWNIPDEAPGAPPLKAVDWAVLTADWILGWRYWLYLFIIVLF